MVSPYDQRSREAGLAVEERLVATCFEFMAQQIESNHPAGSSAALANDLLSNRAIPRTLA